MLSCIMVCRGGTRWIATLVTTVALLLALPSGALGQDPAAGSWPSNHNEPTLRCNPSRTRNCTELIAVNEDEGGRTFKSAMYAATADESAFVIDSNGRILGEHQDAPGPSMAQIYCNTKLGLSNVRPLMAALKPGSLLVAAGAAMVRPLLHCGMSSAPACAPADRWRAHAACVTLCAAL